jgi:phosphoadenosine phosphosulfate reductase
MAVETQARLELKARVEVLNDRYRDMAPEAVLRQAIAEEFCGGIGLVSSFGADSAVLLHMVAMIDPRLPVIFLDTGKHFDETLRYKDELLDRLGLVNVIAARPGAAAVAADDPDGNLHKRDQDLCCHVRKTVPMIHALHGLKCWITGRKRQQSATRANLELFEFQDSWIKINPLLHWSAADVEAYFDAHGLPRHPLLAQGYPSIGCAVCTQPVAPGADSRSGRWAGSAKQECGIHFENGKIVRGGG